jgi:hypothetical protein
VISTIRVRSPLLILPLVHPPSLSVAQVEHIWNTVFRSPSIFGRLLAVSDLHNPSTGRYEHPQLAVKYDADAVGYALRQMHLEIFRDWLSFRLQQQQRDLSVWLSSLGRGRGEGSQLLYGVHRRLRALVPSEVPEHEQVLFFNDFETVRCLACRLENLASL